MHLIPDLFRAAVGRPPTDSGSAYRDEEVAWCLKAGLGPVLDAKKDILSFPLVERWGERVKAAALTGRVLAQQQVESTQEILQCVGALARPPVLLKGISTATQYYPWHYWRAKGDVDLLVRVEDVSAMEAVLQSLGYHQESPYPPEFYQKLHHGMPFVHPRTGVWVEIHRGLFPPGSVVARDGAFSPARWEAALQPGQFGNEPILRFGAEFQLAYTACHWWSEFSAPANPFGLLDCVLILTEEGNRFDWDALMAWVGHPPAWRRIAAMLAFIEMAGLYELPAAISRSIAPDTQAGRLQNALLLSLVRRYAFGGRLPGRVLTSHNLAVVCRTLLRPRPPWRNLSALPARVLIESPDGQGQQDWSHQVRRVINFLSRLLPKGRR